MDTAKLNKTPFSDANAKASTKGVISSDQPKNEQQKVQAADRALPSVVSFGKLARNGSVSIDFDAISGFSRFNKK